MEIYRKQMNKEILESLKIKILNYLKDSGFQKCEFIKKNLDSVEGLYVENLKERTGSSMCSRGRPNEIVIDKKFASFDENDNLMGIDGSSRKLIMTQLTHELIHTAARFNGYTGIRSKNNYGALNEGMTQMFTEKIWGYTVSPNNEGYKTFKKIAKILDITFGEQVSIDAYFNHSNALKNACNNLSCDDKFYSDMNEYLSLNSPYSPYKAENIPQDRRDAYTGIIENSISKKVNDLIYDKICAQIIIPKLNTLSKNERRKIFARYYRLFER